MKLTKEEILHIADLARLDLSEEELKTYGNQLSHVLEYIEQLQAVDVSDTEPTAQVTGRVNVLREDAVAHWDKEEQNDALAQAPQKEGSFIKVKRILD